MKTGSPWWRYLPGCFGKPNTVFKAFRRWSTSHKLRQLLKWLIHELDREWFSISGPHVRAHQSSAGSADRNDQAIAKRAGGNSSKIQISDDVMHDVKIAPELLKKVGLKGTHILNECS